MTYGLFLQLFHLVLFCMTTLLFLLSLFVSVVRYSFDRIEWTFPKLGLFSLCSLPSRRDYRSAHYLRLTIRTWISDGLWRKLDLGKIISRANFCPPRLTSISFLGLLPEFIRIVLSTVLWWRAFATLLIPMASFGIKIFGHLHSFKFS